MQLNWHCQAVSYILSGQPLTKTLTEMIEGGSSHSEVEQPISLCPVVTYMLPPSNTLWLDPDVPVKDKKNNNNKNYVQMP